MCWRLCCPFHQDSKDGDDQDDLCRILIFGVTGVVGGSVMEACTSCAWFTTKGFTRAEQGDFIELLAAKNVTVAKGDMSDYASVRAAMDDVDVVFLTTHYWETLSVDNEWTQGYNVVQAALQAGVRHLIYASTDYHTMTSNSKCLYLEAKARIEDYIVNCGIPSTVLHLGFFYENFLGLFKPHKTSAKDFAIAFPMGNVGLNMASALDFGQCVMHIALRPQKYVYNTLKLASECLTVDEIAQTFNENFTQYMNFYNPQLTLQEYKTLEFDGSEELAMMWEHYSSSNPWDTSVFRSMIMNSKTSTLKEFVRERENDLLDILLGTVGGCNANNDDDNNDTKSPLGFFSSMVEYTKTKTKDTTDKDDGKSTPKGTEIDYESRRDAISLIPPSHVSRSNSTVDTNVGKVSSKSKSPSVRSTGTNMMSNISYLTSYFGKK